MRLKTAMTAVAVPGALLLLGLTACGSSAGATSSTGTSTASVAGTTATLEVLNGEKATTYGILGPDGRGHDSFVPSHLTLKAGVPVTFTVINYDEGPHTITIPDLGINQQIAPRKDDNTPGITTFTVTFSKSGDFRWFCALPCDGGQGGWAMTQGSKGPDQENAMAGYVSVVSSL